VQLFLTVNQSVQLLHKLRIFRQSKTVPQPFLNQKKWEIRQ